MSVRFYARTGRRSGVSGGPLALAALVLLALGAAFAYLLAALAFLLVAGGGYALVELARTRRTRKGHEDADDH